jgi:hypothetical protein
MRLPKGSASYERTDRQVTFLWFPVTRGVAIGRLGVMPDGTNVPKFSTYTGGRA